MWGANIGRHEAKQGMVERSKYASDLLSSCVLAYRQFSLLIQQGARRTPITSDAATVPAVRLLVYRLSVPCTPGRWADGYRRGTSRGPITVVLVAQARWIRLPAVAVSVMPSETFEMPWRQADVW